MIDDVIVFELDDGIVLEWILNLEDVWVYVYVVDFMRYIFFVYFLVKWVFVMGFFLYLFEGNFFLFLLDVIMRELFLGVSV